jgi:hypothetical protein
VLGDVVERQQTFTLGRITSAAGEQAAQPAVASAIRSQKDDRRRVGRSDFGADQQLQPRRPRRHMRPHDSRQAVAIGDSQSAIPQLGGSLYQLIGMRGPFEKGEIRPAVQLGIGNTARQRESRDLRLNYRLSFRWRQFRHLYSIEAQPSSW